MNKTPFFSVIVPTYNPPDLIFRTLESVIAQSFKDFEIIIVDDCSPQDVRAKLARYVDAGQIRYAKNEVNAERSVTRNHGMRLAQGQWLTFLDHDDLMYPGCLEDAHQFVTKNPDFQFFHNLNELIAPDRRPLGKYQMPLTNDPAWDLVNGNFMACIGAYIRRDAFEKVKFDETPQLLWSEDYEYWLRLLAHTKKMGRISKVNSGIVEHPARTVHKIALERTVSRALFLIEKVKTNQAFTSFYSPRYLKRFEAVRYLVVAIAFESAGEFKKSAHYLLKALKADRSVLAMPLYVRSMLRMPYRAATRLFKSS